MTLVSPLWLTAGVVVGGLHAAWRWQAARRASSMRPAIGRVRLLGVAVVLVGAAGVPGMGRRRLGVHRFGAASEQGAMTRQIFGDPVCCQIGSVPVTETMVTLLGVTLLLVVAAVARRMTIVRRPHHWLATLALLTVAWLDALIRDLLGQPHPVLATRSGRLLVCMAGGNIVGQWPGIHPATASVATTSALAAEHGMRLTATEAALPWIDTTSEHTARQLTANRSATATQEVLDIVAGTKARRRP